MLPEAGRGKGSAPGSERNVWEWAVPVVINTTVQIIPAVRIGRGLTIPRRVRTIDRPSWPAFVGQDSNLVFFIY